MDEETGLYYYGARYLDAKYSRWLSADPAVSDYVSGTSAGEGGIYNQVNFNLYHYANNNPVKYTDPDGNFVETAWDIFSLATGVASLVTNVKAGNVKGAVIDGLGIVADVAAVALPCIPGGASAAIKAARITGSVANIAGGALSVQDGLENRDYLEAGLGVLQAVSGVGQLSKAVSAGSKVSEAASSAKSISAKSNHGNSLNTTKPAQGYALKNRNTGEVLKYGETTRGEKRYTKKYLNKNNARIEFQTNGTKREMHDWQHEKILDYKTNNKGQRPRLNKSDW